MKAVWCIILILSVSLIISTLDSAPDPPAVNPGAGISKILPLDGHAPDILCQQCDTFADPRPLPFRFVAALEEPSCPLDRMVLTGRVTDTSPPARNLAHALFQS